MCSTNCPESIPWHRYRAWLRLIVAQGISGKFQAKIDPSDVVQQTIVQAIENWPSFRGSTERELMAWLRTILSRRVLQSMREFKTQRRNIDREWAIDQAVHSSAQALENLPCIQSPHPIDQVIGAERLLRMCDALETLPESQKLAITLHHFETKSIAEVADIMQRSPASVAGLLKRGMRSLRQTLRRDERIENSSDG